MRPHTRIDRDGCCGFSMLELMIALALMAPLLIIIVSSSDVSNATLKANDSVAHVGENLQRVLQRTGQFARPCVLSSYQVEANAADVLASLATNVGDWIGHTNTEARTSVRFRSADGELSMNASQVTDYRILRFVLESGEVDNDVDDDGDGLVDEGSLHLVYEGKELVLARQLESCSFTLDGRLLTIAMQAAEIGRAGRIYRARLSQSIYMRNN